MPQKRPASAAQHDKIHWSRRYNGREEEEEERREMLVLDLKVKIAPYSSSIHEEQLSMRTRGCTALGAEETRWLPQVACCAACCFICICCEGGKLPRQLWAGSCNAILLNCSRKWQWQATEGPVAIGECSAKCKSQCDRQLEAIAARFACDLRAFCVRLLLLLLKEQLKGNLYIIY